MKQFANKVGRRFAMAVAALLFATTLVQAQEPYVFMEGSIHSFSVEFHEGNSFVWSFHTETFDPYEEAVTYIDGNSSNEVTVQFNDLSRASGEIAHLVVTESRNDVGCSTARAIQILLQPNNMYFDFAVYQPETSEECYNYEQLYEASVEVGMNFTDRNGSTDAPIPEDRFPLKVKYTVQNITAATGIIQGNNGEYVTLEYSPDNLYLLPVPEVKGEEHVTTVYELEITEVTDSHGTAITHDEERRVQIRIMNHLPATGGMDVAMVYSVEPIKYIASL